MALYEFEGKVPRVAASAYVAPSAQVVGSVVIGEDCYVGHGAILRGDHGTILVGDGTAIEDGVIVHARPDDTTRFGRRVTVGHGAMVHNATIHDEAVIGMRATVSDFAVVGEGAIIGEMGLVKQHQTVPPRSIAVGLPVQVVGEVTDKNRDMSVWAKEVYIDLARRYPAGLREIAEPARSGEFRFHAIGSIRTPFAEPDQTPIQGAFAPDARGTVELEPHFAPGLRDLDGFSHVVLLYAFHRSRGYDLETKPFLDERTRGLFATRTPRRPNPIGLTVVKLERIDAACLHVSGVDMLDGSPLLDLKPYVPPFDPGGEIRVGWLAGRIPEAG